MLDPLIQDKSTNIKPTILCVDDTPANLSLLSGLLKETYTIKVATSGAKALELLAKSKPDLILLDIMMPEMDGYETCRRIKASPLWKDLPVIFLTAKTESADIVLGFEVGAVDYVGKPFNSHELLARVNTHLMIAKLNKENSRLLLNIIPAAIAEQLKKNPGIIAERFDDVSVLFADIVGFTPLSAHLTPQELISLLNQVFSLFDSLVEQEGLEKIKTIGDAYLVAGGLPDPQPDHLERMVRLALAMQSELKHLSDEQQLGIKSNGLQLRIGIHVGSVVAGVIGMRKFSYDIWGDTVNIASRIESHGIVDRVQVSEAVYERIKDCYSCEPRGNIELKGKGIMPLYLVNSD